MGLREASVFGARSAVQGWMLACGRFRRLLSDDLSWSLRFILLDPPVFVSANGSVSPDGRVFGNMAPPSEPTFLHVALTQVHPGSRGIEAGEGGFDETEKGLVRTGYLLFGRWAFCCSPLIRVAFAEGIKHDEE